MLKWAENCSDSLFTKFIKIQMVDAFKHAHKSKIWLLLLFISGAACAMLISYVGQLSKILDLNSSQFVAPKHTFQPSKVYVDKQIPYKGHIHNPQLFYEEKTSLEIKTNQNEKSGE